MLQVWTMKLTESMNICCSSDRVVCTIKNIQLMSIKVYTINEMRWFTANAYVLNGLQS